MRYPERSVRGVPLALVVGAVHVTESEAASTLARPATTAARMSTAMSSRERDASAAREPVSR
jgi:hypothetical protein